MLIYRWEGLRHGPFSADFFQDAAGLENKITNSAGMDWPVIGSSGELASLMSMVSDQTVRCESTLMLTFRLNSKSIPKSSHPSWREVLSSIPGDYVRTGRGSSTDCLDDQAFEFGMKAKKVPDTKTVAEPPSIYYCPLPRSWPSAPPAGPVNTDLGRLYAEVNKAGPSGISKTELMVSIFWYLDLATSDVQDVLKITREELNRMLAMPHGDMPPAAFWAGYDTARLVSTTFWPEWQCLARRFMLEENGKVNPEGEGEVRCTPRIWVDIWGRKMEGKWEEAVGCAKGWLMSRPGMTEVCPLLRI